MVAVAQRRGDVITLRQVGYALFAFTLFVALPILATRHSQVRRYAGPPLARLGVLLRDHLVPEEVVDPLAAELYRVRRYERLRSDVARLERILATDEWMSATRQLGNRIAYAWLVSELARVRNLSRNIFGEQFGDTWATLAPSATTTPRLVHSTSGGATVEILDIGWRS